jgi:hypothetical protein
VYWLSCGGGERDAEGRGLKICVVGEVPIMGVESFSYLVNEMYERKEVSK